MSLITIVRALGGELYDGGRRAVVPGPGHSPRDRSVSLLVSDGRLVVHSFGRSTWREVIDDLRRRGLINASASLGDAASSARGPAPSTASRVASAARLWSEASPLVRQLSMTHMRLRGIDRPAPLSVALRHHGQVRSAVYADRGATRPALLAAVSNVDGDLCAVEITYLAADGRRASDLTLSRKTIGALPRSSAVRLDQAKDELLVGEGVFTTLSASARFGMPGWALLSASNLRAWAPPAGVRRVLIAADRGVEGERSARQLYRRLVAAGVGATIAWPAPPAGDWNEEAQSGGEGRAGKGRRSLE